jgi:hypothetical protein
MSHRSKHLRRNWNAERLQQAEERAQQEAQRPAPAPRERHRRALPVLGFLGIHR